MNFFSGKIRNIVNMFILWIKYYGWQTFLKNTYWDYFYFNSVICIRLGSGKEEVPGSCQSPNIYIYILIWAECKDRIIH